MHELARFVVLLPRNAGVLMLRGYRAVISPLYGDVCRYYPSCSAYGLGSIQQRGLVIGSALTAWRIVRCNPWTDGGIDEVRQARHDHDRITRFGWVVPAGPMFMGRAGSRAEADAAAAGDPHRLEHRRPEASDRTEFRPLDDEPALSISAPIPSRKD